MSEAELLTTQEVAQALGLDDSHVRRLRIKGELTAISRGGTWFFRRSDVEAFKRARDAKKTAKKAEVKNT